MEREVSSEMVVHQRYSKSASPSDKTQQQRRQADNEFEGLPRGVIRSRCRYHEANLRICVFNLYVGRFRILRSE